MSRSAKRPSPRSIPGRRFRRIIRASRDYERATRVMEKNHAFIHLRVPRLRRVVRDVEQGRGRHRLPRVRLAADRPRPEPICAIERVCRRGRCGRLRLGRDVLWGRLRHADELIRPGPLSAHRRPLGLPVRLEPSKKASGCVVPKEIPPTPLCQRGESSRLTTGRRARKRPEACLSSRGFRREKCSKSPAFAKTLRRDKPAFLPLCQRGTEGDFLRQGPQAFRSWKTPHGARPVMRGG
jgi:hypothetical protein